MYNWEHDEMAIAKDDARKSLDPIGDLARQMCLTWVIGCFVGFVFMVGMYVLLTVCPDCRA